MVGFIITNVRGVWQVTLIIVIVLLFFWGKKIPTFIRSLFKGNDELKKEINDNDDESKSINNENTKQ
ncbi:MAG: twin-arginine translocase TatA/TatE family subunit [Bacteroidales bacterium]|jgi:Sec-independent protein translocase protein TatA|nr:twin-arginine translocase TatA/TatE family subunit [Bacteroidales bacterium]MDD4671623.1 twin-arginine translocase TatA/TatE family subunit [Bacteroidales bacterium]MDY0348834.1 twin-arginine translocase TatA/TatE family subunit [Tenuifilaceae bacterium]